MRTSVLIAVGFLIASLSGCMAKDSAAAAFNPVSKTGIDSKVVGWVNFTKISGGLRANITIIGGLLPGEHGIHIHANGDCGANETAAAGKAGGHFNPGTKMHGEHAGDLGNILIGANGKGTRSVTPDQVPVELSIGTGKFDIKGLSVVVHEKRDDGKTDPSGGSGGRVLCGIIG